jgi:hypothetical protein
MNIVVKFDGGLGNQMSQFAMYTLLKEMYKESKMICDLSAFRRGKNHNGYELEKIFSKIKLNHNSVLEEIKIKCGLGGYQRIKQQFSSGYPEDKLIYRLDLKQNYYVDGTWHNYNYMPIREQLMNLFEFPNITDIKNSKLFEEMKLKNSVSVHVRRGDYVQLGLDIIGKDYYEKAMDFVASKVKSPVFFVFSDECVDDFFKQNKYKVVFVKGNKNETSYIDMQLMKSCKHNIIANSTFSYWGAWLNDNPEKIVVRPRWQTAERQTWKVDGWYIL